jgi:hypothetical protein
MMTAKKYPATVRAAYQRKVYGGPRSAHREYVLVDEDKGEVLGRWDAFPVTLARKVGALADWEEIR